MAGSAIFVTRRNRRSALLPWVLLLPLFALLAWLFWPVTRADFVADDYVFLTTARMVNEPLAAFWQSHFYEPYYFRPIGVVSWWLATRLFGLDYHSHSLINLVLHCINAGLLFALLRALALSASAVAAGVALFALGPAAFAAVLWPSNRFDLLAAGFLLVQAIATVRALHGRWLAIAVAALAALAACWSKEGAYPVATAMALVVLAASGVSWRLRLGLFALLGSAIGGAFFWRHRILTDAYAVSGADPIGQAVDGAVAMVSSLPRLMELVVGAQSTQWLGWGLLAALLLSLIWSRRESGVSRGLLGSALFVFSAAFIVQTPLAKLFASMLDGGPFGTVTFARFYYAPWAALSVVVALVLARGRLGRFAAIVVVALTAAVGLSMRPLGESFAAWTQKEIAPMSLAASRLVDSAGDSPCVFVLLGTQAKQPFFRMFSDVTVKALTVQPAQTWRCHVMTESTPWLFAFPVNDVPADLPLRKITDAAGVAKADSAWGGIRYRYRLPANDLPTLPGARFFDWRDGRFVEVTEDVRSGAQKVKSKDW